MIKSATAQRIESIDLLRGIVMILMALDHVRDYFHADAFLYNPVDLSKTSVTLFFTRWVTHFCAPVFVFLAGTSAFLVGSRKGKQELTVFLLKRGIWLVVLELTIINFSWFFNFHFPLPSLFVIWALGMGMIILSVCIYLPFPVILGLGIVLVAGHNLLDGVHVAGDGAGAILWSILHEFHLFTLSPDRNLFIGYPLIPWTGIMLLGYCFGTLYTSSVAAADRKKILVYLGTSAIALFIVIRFFNSYGDPNPWSVQSSPVYTFLSFINVTKYPPSLLYALITLGPALLLLAGVEAWRGSVAAAITTLGRVPMFYYLLHIYLIHILAIIAALATGYQVSDMVFTTWVTDSPNLKGYGFGLPVVYLVWFGVVGGLYPLCKWYERYKAEHRAQWWLSYL
ncbi:Uncharacterized membrane protein [Chryseolinea serpens]|uniref:Uncharacterized membrane protein n=1 Tax=Chryseolinea serpens TaxID=947013 RepID=A0A1M5XPF0_9BACT|nr:heparan-alpha-glucosaminide N-acetyltransferase domain-containing protein [Chryseolinea serpens]SHI01717.1 Uncharacterized membrane protein [Chryseolinea serpens]